MKVKITVFIFLFLLISLFGLTNGSSFDDDLMMDENDDLNYNEPTDDLDMFQNDDEGDGL